jgi:TolA-binding protein
LAASVPRRLWQIPVFFVGVVALVAVCLAQPFLKEKRPERQLHHDLAEVRRLLHHKPANPDEVLQIAQRAVDQIMYAPERETEAIFLLGSAHVRVAESATGPAAEEHWRAARQYLEEAQRRNLSGEDAGRLRYRLAKVGFHTNDDTQKVIEQLKASNEQADDRAEAYTLLSQAYLRLNPPNLQEALLANEALRRNVPQVGEEVLGPAKLAGAKILLRLNRGEDARKALEKIVEPAPPAILCEARMLLAGLYQEEQKWPEAAELWKLVLNEKRVPVENPGGALYNLGVCCQHLEQSSKAAEAWTECIRRTDGEEAQASALALAEWFLHDAKADKAIEMLRQAVAKVRKAEDWKNSLLDLPRVRDLFERAIEICRQANRFDLAVRAAELYERVAVIPKAQLLRADRATEWARSRREAASKTKDAKAREKEETAASRLFVQAALAHEEGAKLTKEPVEKDERLWQSAVCSHDGKDYERAVEKLAKIVQVEGGGVDRQSEGWYLLGESYRHLHNKKDADAAYKKCVENDARFACRARYQLAMLDVEAGQIDQAKLHLNQNLNLEHNDPDPEAREKSRFALCSLLYRAGAHSPQDYRQVIVLLDGILERVPLSPEAVRARYQLADSYRQLSLQRTMYYTGSSNLSPQAHEHFLKENKRSLQRAAEEFGKLEELLKNAEMVSLLTLKQRVAVPFIVAECSYFLGEYEKALLKYEALAKQWGKGPNALRALGETVRCYGALADFDKLRQRVEEIRALVAATEGLSEGDKQQWNAWLDQVSKRPEPIKEGDNPSQRGVNERAPASNRDG